MSRTRFDIAMVGGGFSGTLLAVQLLRRAPSLSLAVVDKGPLPGRGVAYGTRYSCHLLNVPASDMSAIADEPDHFLKWAKANYRPTVQPTTFLPRAIYGRYLGSLLEESARHGAAGNLQWIPGEVSSVSCEQSRIELQLADRSTLSTKFLVLSVGNFPPANLKIPGLCANNLRYARSPWSATVLRTNFREMSKQGLRPFIVGALGEILIACLTLGLVIGANLIWGL